MKKMNTRTLRPDKQLVLILLLIVVFLFLVGCISMTGLSYETEEDPYDELIVAEKNSSNEKFKYENKKIFDVSDEERELLAKLVSCEASICGTDCKRAVVSVVFNRLNAGKWGNTIYDVVYYPNAFTPVLTGKINQEAPDKSCYEAVDYVLENGCTVPTEVRYFRTDYDFNWDGYVNYTIIENVYFGYFTDWRNGAW